MSSDILLHRNSMRGEPTGAMREFQAVLEVDTLEETAIERALDILDINTHQWPVFASITAYQTLYNTVPEDMKQRQDSGYCDRITQIHRKIKDSYSSVADFLIPDADTPAILGSNLSQPSISHQALHQFVRDFDLGLPPLPSGKQRVVVALPSGPMMGLACLAVATYYTMAPMTPSFGAEQFRSDMERVHATAILVSTPDAEKLQLRGAHWIVEAGIRVFVIENQKDGTFSLSTMIHGDVDQHQPTLVPPTANNADDIAIVLFTSGTSGTKKLVPITTHTLVSGVAFVIKSWGLQQSDRCLNMMPLHHIGGILRNLFAPVMAGGSTICCSSFDPNVFWDLVEDNDGPTWYYASPSMHAAILSEAVNRPEAVNKHRIRLVCNAAGGLLPTMATQLRDTFAGCTVLPSYGMTECMPIATPPLDYRLDRPGASGISAGPELSIQDPNDVIIAPGFTGSICVRGPSVFPGYLGDDGKIEDSAIKDNGWFDTGDVGYLDHDGYLYITGRNKEVINRGGEILSPFEIEEAVVSASTNPHSVVYGRVSECLAFSMPHDILQEVVGLAMVVSANKPRPSLDQLHEAVKHSLHPTKWPAILVYMTDLPRARNKVLRIKLSERLDMPTMTNGITHANQYYEATCPPAETGLTVKIPKTKCNLEPRIVARTIQGILGDGVDVFAYIDEADGFLRVIVCGDHGVQDSDASAKKTATSALQNRLQEEIHGYLVPKSVHFVHGPMPLCDDGDVDRKALDGLLKSTGSKSQRKSEGPIQEGIMAIFATVLSCSSDDIDLNTNFFAAGGDSLGAGRLLALLRRQFKVRLASETLYSNPSVSDIATLIESSVAGDDKELANGEQTEKAGTPLPGCTQTRSSTNSLVLLLHLLPIVVVYPLRLAFWWTLFLYGMAELPRKFLLADKIEGRLLLLLLVMTGATIAVSTIAPILGVAMKWIIIGRHKEGLYPMWGSYHNRWWLTQKILLLCGKGIFEYSNYMRILYYRLLGAKIGRNVAIHEKAKLGEYDLIEIGDNTILDRHSICRPFAVERNTSMLLSPIRIGRDCTIGLSSVIAPGSFLPVDTCIGSNYSSWEIGDANEENRDLITSSLPQPHWTLKLLIIEPVAALAWLIGRAPWLASLIGMIQTFPRGLVPDHEEAAARWYTSTKRIGFHYLARISNDTLGPVALFLFVLLVKQIVDSRWACGPIESGTPTKSRSQMQKLRAALLQGLMPEGDLGKLASLVGSHYEFVSILVRALGGRVGKRVYWPGVGPTMQDFELLDIGDDVVFGSRAHLVTSNQTESSGISLGSGCMVADRAVVQPGTIIGKRTVLGSGALTRPHEIFPADSVWVGSKAGGCIRLQHKGEDFPQAAMEIDSKSSTPFGRALYQGDASYHVIGLPFIACYSFLTTVFVSLYWNTSTILGMKVVALILHSKPSGFHQGAWYRPFSICALLTASIAVISTLQAILALGLVVGAKWSLIGHRSPGSFDWDKSSYCQRWQVLLTFERVRQRCYGGVGILNLLTGTHYIVLFFRALGGHIGKNCALFANGNPSLLFTEPDLLVLGDRVAVDDASLVSHINSRGHFKLNKLSVGDRSVLRTGSRLLSGASMGDDACLLEHTLVMAGDHVEAGDTYQGWPGILYQKKRV